MSVVGILNPESLVGIELVRLLGERPDLAHEVKLFTTDEERAGTLTDVGSEVALVSLLDPQSAGGLDALFLCGAGGEAEIAALPAGTVRILVATDSAPAGSLPIVAGVNRQAADPGAVLVSPHPAVVASALLLHPLAELGATEAACWILQSASIHGRAGLDELFEQSRSLLNFKPEMPQETLGGQLAFNVVPAAADGAALAAELGSILGTEAQAAMTLLQGGIFHGMLVSLLVTCSPGTSSSAVKSALDSAPALRLAARAELGGPVAAASGEVELVASLEAAQHRDGAFWITGVLDNLILGGAVNAIGIAEAALAARSGSQPS